MANKWKEWQFATLLPASAQRKMPWKNGRGSTREIAIEPAGSTLDAGDFYWRLSSAEIREDGPFSAFPGYERLLALVKGSQLSLLFPDRRGELRAGEVCTFSGKETVIAELPQGPVTDLGLIFRPESAQAQMTFISFNGKPRSFQLSSENVLLFAVSGEFSATVYPGELEFALNAGDALKIGPLPAERLVMLVPGTGDAVILAVEID